MRVSYFPCCYLRNFDQRYEKSLDIVCKQLGIETEEVLNWSCCGGEILERTDAEGRYLLPLRNLAISEKLTKNPVFFVPAPQCFHVFARTREWFLQASPEEQKKALEYIGLPYSGKTEVKNLLQVMEDHQASAKIKKFLMRNLNGLKVVCYYGCKSTRPSSYVPDLGDPERIDIMERYIKMAGGEPLPFLYSQTCNGGHMAHIAPQEGLKMIGTILAEAIRIGGEAIVVICPVCFYNLDALQKDALKAVGKTDGKEIPVLYLTELLALVMGANIAKLDLNHYISLEGILKKLGILLGKK
ncbi:MAG: heterodisulfide reductase-related iron-sulfur binding cluster [bacterium JZ-2024 1]